MGPPKTTAKAGRTISHEAFDDLVKENMDGLQDAIQTLTLQGVDLFAPISQNPIFTLPSIWPIRQKKLQQR